MGLIRAYIAVLLAAIGACGDDDDDDEATRHAVGQATASFESFSGIDTVTDTLFAPDPTLASTPVAQARLAAIARVRGQIDFVAAALTCASPPEIESDGMSYIDIVADDCQSDVFGNFDGHWLFMLDFDTAACGPDLCPTFVRWELSSPDPADPARFSGPYTFLTLIDPVTTRFSVDPLGPRTLQTNHYEVAAYGPAPGYAVRIDATWTRADGCFDASAIDATISVPTTGRHPDREETYPIVYSVRDLGDCPSACPTSGDIDISFANGDIISWEFTGAAEVTVTGPRGYTLDVPLSCL